jgi:hypothetical protein
MPPAPAVCPGRLASGDSTPAGQVRSARGGPQALPTAVCEPLLEFEAGSNLFGFAGLCAYQLLRQPTSILPCLSLNNSEHVFFDIGHGVHLSVGRAGALLNLRCRRPLVSYRRVITKSEKLKYWTAFTTSQEENPEVKKMQNTTLNTPAIGGGYAPYFYQWGLFETQGLPSTSAPNPPANSTYARYDFTSDLIQPRRPDHHQTVEDIVAKGYLAIPQEDPATAIISDRQHTSWLGLDDIISQIRRRYDIHEKLMYEMELAKCAASNSIFRLEAESGGVPANSKERYSEDKRVQEIYQEQREEQVNLWRDVSRLRLSLPELAQLYLGAYRKARLLNDAMGDSK